MCPNLAFHIIDNWAINWWLWQAWVKILAIVMASSWLGWIIFINSCRWLFHVGHLKSQCITSSTSPELHSLQVLSSRFTPRHLPISTWRGAVPPRNLTIILLSVFIFIPAHRDSSPHSMMMVCIVDNFGFLSSSSLHFSCTFLHATLSSIPLSSVSDRFWMCIYMHPQSLTKMPGQTYRPKDSGEPLINVHLLISRY